MDITKFHGNCSLVPYGRKFKCEEHNVVVWKVGWEIHWYFGEYNLLVCVCGKESGNKYCSSKCQKKDYYQKNKAKYIEANKRYRRKFNFSA